jgi:nucleotidyltransferase substrate binding protein (TIGR01987 family)
MSKIKLQQSFENLGRALERLEEGVTVESPNQLMIDGTIQRFEFTLELFWKTLKRLLAYQGIEALSPRSVLKQAYQLKWINKETIWLEMLDDRNRTSHVYDEETAAIIYEHVKKNFVELKAVFTALQNSFKDILN